MSAEARPDRLERGYRRMMRVYPRSYRQARADEIVGVLLDDAAPGQTRPRGVERWDLLCGGLRAWWAAPPSGPVSTRWLDAASGMAVVLPVMFAINAFIGIGNVVTTWIDHPLLERSLPARSILVGLVGWTLVAVNILRARCRSASHAATVTAFVSVGFDFIARLTMSPDVALGQPLFALLPSVVLLGFVVIMLARPGTGERGVRLLGWKLLVVTAASLSFGSNALVAWISDNFMPGSSSGPLYQSAIVLAAAATMFAVICVLLRRRSAGTTLAVLTVVAVAFISPVGYFVRLHWLGDPRITSTLQALVIVAAPIAIAVFSSVSHHDPKPNHRSRTVACEQR